MQSERRNEDLRNQSWYPVLKSRDVNEAWMKIRHIVLEIFDKHAPRILKKVKGKLAPWLTDDIKKLLNEIDKLLPKARKCQDAELYKTKYKQRRNAVDIAIRRAKASYYANLVRETQMVIHANSGKLYNQFILQEQRFQATVKCLKLMEKTRLTNLTFQIASVLCHRHCCIFKTSVIIAVALFVWQLPCSHLTENSRCVQLSVCDK